MLFYRHRSHSLPAAALSALLTSSLFTGYLLTGSLSAQVAVNATVNPPAGGAPVAANIGSIAVVVGPGANIDATFSFNGAAAGFPNGFAFLDDWYDFRWINIVTSYTVNGAPVLDGAGNPVIPFAGMQQRLPLIDPPPQAAGGDDDDPYYFTAAEWAAGTFGGLPINPNAGVPGAPVTRFLDSRAGWPAGAAITFETYLVVDSITDPAIAANEIVVLDGFTWTYTQGPPAVAAGGAAIAPNPGRVNAALGNAAGGGFPAPGGGAAWTALPSGNGAGARVLTGCPGICVPQGPGCVAGFTSFYEQLAPAAMDLSGMRLIAANIGAPTQPAFVTMTQPGLPNPIGALGPPQPVPLGNDQVVPVGQLGLFVSSNGNIYFGPGGTQGFDPLVAELLSQPAAGIYSWSDLDPSAPGSGQVWYEESGAFAQITYDAVYFAGTTSPNTVQFFIDTQSGDFEITWGSVSPNSQSHWLVGYSPAGPSLDPGASDLSADVVQTMPIDLLTLELRCVSPPVQGPAPTSFDVTTTNVGPNPVFHLGLLGLTSPGISLDLAGFPADCLLNASPDVIVGPAVVPGGGALTWTALTLPAGPPSFVGFEFRVQAVTLEASGINQESRSSNGLHCTVGSQ